MTVYKANDSYSATLTAQWTHSPADNTMAASSVPTNTPTIITAAYDTDNETVFTVTGSSGGNTLTGVTRISGANVDLPQGTTLTCLNNAEFVNQYETAVFDQSSLKGLVYGADGGSSDTYEISLSPAPSAYADVLGLPITFLANTANTGAATLDLNDLGPISIKKQHDATLETNDIEAGQLVTVVYDGTNFQMQSQTAQAASTFNFWNDVPGTPTRVSDTQFTITDASNANLYDLIFKRGVILKWMESTTFQTAMVASSSYGTNTVTINIVGDTLTAGFTAMKYAIAEISAISKTFVIPGTLPSVATTNISTNWRPKTGIYILSADLDLTTGGSGSGSTVVDINVSGTTKFTIKPTITSTAVADINNVADNPSTEVAAESDITVDVDSVTSTAPVDAYVTIFCYPSAWRYRA